MRRPCLFLACALACALSACRHDASPPGADASAPPEITVRVPGALRVARALDTLTVEIDTAADAETKVRIDPSMSLGVESTTRVYAVGDPKVLGERHGYTSGVMFDVGQSIWNTRTDGVPEPGKKYVAEMKLVLFQTDVAPRHLWNPRAGQFKVLLARTLRQAEE